MWLGRGAKPSVDGLMLSDNRSPNWDLVQILTELFAKKLLGW